MASDAVYGFIGLGVMGEPMCRHLRTKSGATVIGYDLSPEPLARLAAHGVETGKSLPDAIERASIVFISLPSGRQLEAVCRAPDGLLARCKAGQTVVDLGTSPVRLSRELAAEFAKKGVRYADAPVARTRQAAESGTLAITVGASPEIFALIEPLLRCFAAEVTHCGDVGAGQIVKILNNMVVVGTVVALSEAAAIARSVGFDTRSLFETLTKGSADSFPLRNHGLRSVATGQFPERTFSSEYMLKDIGYALEMAREAALETRGARYGRDLLEAACETGHRDEYWPVISTLMQPGAKIEPADE
jgi:3-hydroxyisobutyrate dehydrogenase-like beta-hydroxyacid dehydrogenase